MPGIFSRTPKSSEADAIFDPQGVIPGHVGIIMDGNGRWARARGLPRAAGHRAGTKNIRRVLTESVEIGIKVLTIYAFSTENWARPKDEVDHLMRLISQSIQEQLDDLDANGVRILHSGRLEEVNPSLQKEIRHAIDRTRHNDSIVLNVAFNYGGRAEIVDAIKEIMREGIPPEEVTEEVVSQHLYTPDLPDPDLIIRTGGEFRLSNFLIWQAAYAEFYSTPVYWPDFDEAELRKAVAVFQHRDRRFGKIEDTER
ncbi:MAG TPA: isoprenyl transferase [Anaerolineae bacterium]|nr:isoprenyl transferase [Caldilineae bacterium]HID34086.1 isoprenyl transferase [Anaerolineae bacterium]HIQ12736.1 isoprenyl transferase [Caldilineales bacterium]